TERLRAAGAGLRGRFHGLFGQFGVRLANVVDVPIGDRWSVRRQRWMARRIETERPDFAFVFLRVGDRNHREVVEVAAKNGLRSRIDVGPRNAPGDVSDQCGCHQKHRKHSLHKNPSIPEKTKNSANAWTMRFESWPN